MLYQYLIFKTLWEIYNTHLWHIQEIHQFQKLSQLKFWTMYHISLASQSMAAEKFPKFPTIFNHILAKNNFHMFAQQQQQMQEKKKLLCCLVYLLN